MSSELAIPFAWGATGLVEPEEAHSGVDYLCSSEACRQVVRLYRAHTRQGDIEVRAHFRHLAGDHSAECSWVGGESEEHFRAKHRVVELLATTGVEFFSASCGHPRLVGRHQGRGQVEVAYAAEGTRYRLDVGIFDDSGVLVAAVEVRHQHACESKKLHDLQAAGVPVFEIAALDVLEGRRLDVCNDAFFRQECPQCAAWEARRQEEAAKRAASQKEEEAKRMEVLQDLMGFGFKTPQELARQQAALQAQKEGYFSGRVLSVVFENPHNVFYIVQMVLDSGERSPVTVKGTVPGIKMAVGAWFGFEGRWDDHKEYGRQVLITRAPVLRGGWDAETASKTLVAHGVGSQIVQAIRDHFGDDKFLEALGEPSWLAEVPGLSTFSAMHVVSRWEAVKAQFEALEILSSLGLPKSRVRDIWAHFGEDTQHVLVTNPWALVEVDGITFAEANEVAARSGLSNPTLQMRGAVLYSCKAHRAFGHMFLRPGLIVSQVQENLPDAAPDQILAALAALNKEGLLVIDREARPGTTAVYEPWAYETEEQSAQCLLQRQQTARYLPEADQTKAYMTALGSNGPKTAAAVQAGSSLEAVVRVAIEEWGERTHLVLSEPQKEGILHALTAPVSILSGLPGTGKTTSLKAAVRILQDAGVPFLLCAPTGIAAKNLSARTGAVASTIHRAFAARGQAEGRRGANYTGVVGGSQTVLAVPGAGEEAWGYGPEHPHPADVVIIDEASMVDQYLLYRLLDCTRPEARLVFVGDHAQLPSVGPGNVLRDLLGSGLFPTVKLTQIFRQDDTSGIVYAAHSIHLGDVPELNKDFRLLALPSEEAVLDAVLKIGKRFFDERKNFQILSPKHNGTVGVTNLNARLRELLNPASPGQHEIRLGADTIREGDRIMIIQNDYKLGVFNGDVGKVAKVDKTKKEVEIKVFGEPPLFVRVTFKEVPRLLRLAYACTVHKAQGLEYDHIVMPLVTGFRHQLQRNLLYTAITRAKKQVFLLGQREALALAVLNAKEDERTTLFRDRLLGPGSIPPPTE